MERQKVSPILMVSAAIAIIATVYVFYITVFEQIIDQNQGYFYAVIFGFILLVLFLLCNLFTKLIAISVGEQRSSYRRLIIAIGLVLVAVFFLATRMRYSTSLSPFDYNVYRGAVAMVDGTYAQSHDITDAAIANPGQYLYSLILSIVFRIVEPGVTPVLWVNAFFIILSGFLTYKIVRTFTNQLCGLFAAFLCAFIPSQTFAVYSFTSEPVVAATFLGAVLSLISLYSYNKRLKEIEDYGDDIGKDYASVVFTIVGSLLIGILIFVEPFMIIPFALMVLVAYFTRKPKALAMLTALAAGIVIMVLLCFVKSAHMEVDFGKVMTGEIAAFDPTTDYNSGEVSEFREVFHKFNTELSSTDKNINENFMFISDNSGSGAYTEMNASWVVVLNQIMYMFVLMMTISCVILAVKEQKDYVITISMLIVSAVVMLLFQQNRDDQKFLFITVFIIASSTGLHYLYLDHHPELKVSINALDALEKTGRKEIAAATRSNLINAAQMTEADFMRRAKALIFVGNDEELYRQIKSQEHENAQNYEGRRAVKEADFDDYDEDFFLDNEDNSELQVKVTAVAPSGIRQSVGEDASAYEPNAEMHESANAAYSNTSVPAWKRPEKFGDEEMFDEDEIELDKAHSAFDGRDALQTSAGVTTNEPAPAVEKIKRNSKKVVVAKTEKKEPEVPVDDMLPDFLNFDKSDEEPIPSPVAEVIPGPVTGKAKKEKVKKEKVRKEKSVKAFGSPAKSTMADGKAVRRIKTVGGAAVVTTAAVSAPKAAEPVEPSKPLPNPLPTPKKKDHKPIDYDKDVKKSDDDWDYDYDVADDDDWDV